MMNEKPIPSGSTVLEHWRQELSVSLIRVFGKNKGSKYSDLYNEAFPPGFERNFSPSKAAQDIRNIEKLREVAGIAVNLYRDSSRGITEFRLRLCHVGAPVALSDILPVLENMGLRVIEEVPYNIRARDPLDPVWLHDFGLTSKTGSSVSLDATAKKCFEETLQHVWCGDTENDGLNALSLEGKLTWRQIFLLRAYCKYLMQIGIPFSQSYIEEALVQNSLITRDLIFLFESLFDPKKSRRKSDIDSKNIRAMLSAAMEAVPSLDQDRILRRLLNLIDSTLRTNFYQFGEDNEPKPYIALKLKSSQILELPQPRPYREIFVHAPMVDAIHLRGGKVARGGLRWSDRREDFRSEILGLMKSQMTKNSVIVPVGAKGGFIVKREIIGGHSLDLRREAVKCYKIFISGLLDLTDNIERDKIIPPKNVVRRDGDDPYLVVAADKGTATFSDIANELAASYNYWLGDAFASGGSCGYDHKAMGITAKGAWESVKRHFREIGIDVMAEEFTCIGVGDMSGDVFGNGLIYSPYTKLLAAFNHQHIFIDPNPNPKVSFEERLRLFESGSSSWSDYDPNLISAGGGVLGRDLKSISVSAEMRTVFALGKAKSVTPDELITHILRAKVNLLWFGGIGTYVKSSTESNLEVGDRGNDALRIDAKQLGADVVGEGANLGITQFGRVEFAVAGGKINTDFIDNSAGVDCSDHEVNIKILLDAAVSVGKLSIKARNRLLRRMSDEVTNLVLMDNYRQSMALTNAEVQSVSKSLEHKRLIRTLTKTGFLNRKAEFLPEDAEMDQRRSAGKGLCRPELAVLLTYSKNALFKEILDSNLPEDPYLASGLPLYFPIPIQKRFPDLIDNHPLKRELIATYVANTLINRAGPSFIQTIKTKTGATSEEIARSYLICRQVFEVSKFWDGVESLDNSVSAEIQVAMHLEIMSLLEKGTQWFAKNSNPAEPIEDIVARYREPVRQLSRQLRQIIPKDTIAAVIRKTRLFIEKGTPIELAENISGLEFLSEACEVVDAAYATRSDTISVARVYYHLGSRLGFVWLVKAAQKLADGDDWRDAAIGGLVQDLLGSQAALTTQVIEKFGASENSDRLIDQWISENRESYTGIRALMRELRSSKGIDMAMLVVGLRRIRDTLGL